MTGLNDRPLVTFALFTYNQGSYVRAAVQGALAQRYSPLEIVISDDASTDNTMAIIRECIANYEGSHSIVINENRHNLGIGGHVNRVMELARGDIIVAAAGDDISDRDRVERLVQRFISSTEIYSVWSSARYIDSEGAEIAREFPRPKGTTTDLSITRNINPVIGATHAWRRDVFEIFGPLMKGIMFEDNAISFRSYLLGTIDFVDRDLVSYRVHDDNITNFNRNTDIDDLYRSAARRVRAALIGAQQRYSDLEFVLRRGISTPRNEAVIRNEIRRFSRKLSWRLAAYEQYPFVSSDTILRSFVDLEVAKVVFRSLCRRVGQRRDRCSDGKAE